MRYNVKSEINIGFHTQNNAFYCVARNALFKFQRFDECSEYKKPLKVSYTQFRGFAFYLDIKMLLF